MLGQEKKYYQWIKENVAAFEDMAELFGSYK
jgi:hypothetical protein